jgi:hypothetical protein
MFDVQPSERLDHAKTKGGESTEKPSEGPTVLNKKTDSSMAKPHEVEETPYRAQSSKERLQTLPKETRISSVSQSFDAAKTNPTDKVPSPTAAPTKEQNEDHGGEAEADLDELFNLDKDPLTDPKTSPSPEWLKALGKIHPQ